MSRQRDVIIVGAGPAGSTAGALLAARGIDALVVERDEFPREHVGESLLPACGIVHDVLGVEPTAEAFLHKQGASFVCEQSGRVASFDFAEALEGPPRHAWHVDRSIFDTMLRDRALALGAEVRHGIKVRGVDVDEQGVTVRTDRGDERARFVIDATGQDRLLGRLAKTVEPFGHFGKAASFTQFENVSQATHSEFGPDNNIRIMMLDDGWAWVIPLPGARLSVGVVSRKQGLGKDDVLDYVGSSSSVQRWTHGASPRPPRLIGNFSFRNTAPSGSRFACVGDASCFIDPVFSSGVSLAIRSSMALVEQLAPALEQGTEAAPELAVAARALIEPGYDTFASLVYRFYNTRFVDNFMFNAPPDAHLRASVVSVLAGDVFRPDNPFRDMLRASRVKPWQQPGGARASLKQESA